MDQVNIEWCPMYYFMLVCLFEDHMRHVRGCIRLMHVKRSILSIALRIVTILDYIQFGNEAGMAIAPRILDLIFPRKTSNVRCCVKSTNLSGSKANQDGKEGWNERSQMERLYCFQPTFKLTRMAG